MTTKRRTQDRKFERAYISLPRGKLLVYKTDIYDFCQSLMADNWFKNMYPKLKGFDVQINPELRKDRYNWYWMPNKQIKIELPKRMFGPSEKFILKAIAECMSIGSIKERTPEFCMDFLFIVKNRMGQGAAKLLVEAYKREKVNYGPADDQIEVTLHKVKSVQARILDRKDLSPLPLTDDMWTKGYACACAMIGIVNGPDEAKEIMEQGGFDLKDFIKAGAEDCDIRAIQTGSFHE